jgi:hypothetical protein
MLDEVEKKAKFRRLRKKFAGKARSTGAFGDHPEE